MSRKGSITTAEPLSFEDFNRLINALEMEKEYRWQLFCIVSFYFALRITDVRNLRWSEILNKNEVILTEHKTRKKCKPRRIPVKQDVRDMIAGIYQNMDSPDINQLLLYNPKNRAAYSIAHINESMRKFRDKYRIPIRNFSSHSFRKTFGRYVYEINNRSAESLILLNAIFRHSSLEITKVYIGLRQDEINSVYESIKF
ncbi:tyrosine-type recombinase/integrase [Dysgonomonas termitidis]|uniref:Tyrosine-type recombinase/integrase n=1 Tax=Dysgonomonas termitidis TaxID=1516126 RepID=A0ABV9KRN6_9BACT